MKNSLAFNFGARVESEGVRFTVLAPKCETVSVVLEGESRLQELARDERGVFSGIDRRARVGTRYKLCVEGSPDHLPDPASRFQPEGPHGPSEVIDAGAFTWTDAAWSGARLRGQVIYELHVGTFTRDGTYRAAITELAELRALGVTMIELMPLAEFPGRFGWGYDGVDLYAPFHGYGRPDDLRAFVDAAHAVGIGVILDVVYNHLGPDGNYLERFSDHFFTDKYETDWGRALDFESDSATRAFFIENASTWISDYHFDGLRLDATQNVYDASTPHVLAEIIAAARAAAHPKNIVVIAENEPQEAKIVRARSRGGYGGDALWNDDFHHAARVALTGHKDAYYANTKGTPQELLSALKWGYLFQGQYYPWQEKRRGSPSLDLDAPSFVVFLENHDQVANSARGARLSALVNPGDLRALTTAMLLAPGTPLLFQGQEFASSAPFRYFADHNPDLAALVSKGRVEFMEQFETFCDPRVKSMHIAPNDPRAFTEAKLNFDDRIRNAPLYALHKSLLALRRNDPIFAAQRADWLHGAVLGSAAFLMRFATGTGQDRIVIVNLGADLDLEDFAEPLLAPPEDAPFEILFSSEDPSFGGSGTRALLPDGQVVVAGHSALVLAAGPFGSISELEDHTPVEGP